MVIKPHTSESIHFIDKTTTLSLKDNDPKNSSALGVMLRLEQHKIIRKFFKPRLSKMSTPNSPTQNQPRGDCYIKKYNI